MSATRNKDSPIFLLLSTVCIVAFLSAVVGGAGQVSSPRSDG